MNIAIQADHPPLMGPVLRTSDRMRLEGCVNALTQENLCLSLHCGHEVLLDHYVRLLLTHLRTHSESHQVEVYFPANTESLLERFNAAIADQSISDATRHPRDSQQVRVWVVHDAQKVSESELQLLARLIHNFPGSRIRALLLFHGPSEEPEALQAFGRKLLRWHIDMPTPEQAQDALELAQSEGRQAQVSQLLRRIGCLPQSEPATPLSLGLEAQQQRIEENQRLALPATRWSRARDHASKALLRLQNGWTDLTSGLKSFKGNWGEASSPSKKRLIAGTGVAVVLSLSITAWLQPQAFVGRPSAAASAPAPATLPTHAQEDGPDKKTDRIHPLDSTPDGGRKGQGSIGLVRAIMGPKL